MEDTGQGQYTIQEIKVNGGYMSRSIHKTGGQGEWRRQVKVNTQDRRSM